MGVLDHLADSVRLLFFEDFVFTAIAHSVGPHQKRQGLPPRRRTLLSKKRHFPLRFCMFLLLSAVFLPS